METRCPCPKCHEFNAVGNARCWHCGARLGPDHAARGFAARPIATAIPAFGLLLVAVCGGLFIWKANQEAAPEDGATSYVAPATSAPVRASDHVAMASKVRKRHHRGHHGSHAVSTPKAASNSSPPPPQKTVQGASAGTAFSEGERIISALRSAQSGDKAGITYEACSHLLSEARTSLAGYINRYGQEDPLAPALLDVYRDESYAVEAWSLKLKGTRQDLDSANSVDRTILDAALRANPDLETKLSTRTDDSGAAYCMLPCQDAMDALWSKSAELLDKVSKEFPSGND